MTVWQNIIGHEWAVQLLSGAITHNRVGHAYLITGLEQVGKTALARTFAQALNCVRAVSERPCGECRACVLIAKDRHPDVRLITPEVSGRGKLTIKIDQMRALQHDLNLAAYEGRYKVAIIKRFDAANANAANAFLKTLEEPPENVVLLLTATDADTLLPTIASRCRTVALRPLSTPLIAESLHTRWDVSRDQAHLLAHLADGRLGWAIQAAQTPAILETRQVQLEQLYEALQGRRVARFDLAKRLASKPEEVPAVLKTWLSWWRDLTLLAHSNQSGDTIQSITNIDQHEQLQHLSAMWTPQQALDSLKQTNEALWQLERNANTRLVLENLLLHYPPAR